MAYAMLTALITIKAIHMLGKTMGKKWSPCRTELIVTPR